MKKILQLLALVPSLLLGQTAVQKVGGGGTDRYNLSNGNVVVPSGVSITATGSGSIISTGGVASSMPYTGITTVPTAVLLGRTTAGTGNAEAITAGSSLTLSAGVLNAVQDIRTTASPTFGALTLTAALTGANGGTGVANTGKTITLGGNLTLSGAFATTLTVTATTGLTLPTTGTLSTLAGAEALTNKTYNGNTWTAGTGTLTIAAGKVLTQSATLTYTGSDGSSVNFGTGGTVLYSGGAYVSSITGTAGQIAASASTGAVTLSIPTAVYSITSLGINTGTTAAATGLQVVDTGTGTPRGITDDQYNNGTNSAQFNSRKARGTFATPLTIVTGDILGRDIYWGHDGTAFIESANIRVVSSGTIATSRVPSQMEFYTSTNAAPSVLTLGMTLDSTQKLTVAGYTTTPDLSFSGTTTTGLHLKSLTTTQKNAVSPAAAAGDMVYDSTLGRVQGYDGAAWHSYVRLDGDTMTGALVTTGLTVNTLTTANGLLQTNGSGVVSTTLTPAGLTSVTATTFIGAVTGHSSLDLALTGGTMVGNILFTDNTYDIGASGATRPRTGYFGTSLISPTLTSAAGGNLTLGTGTFGTSVTLASVTGIPTFGTAVVINGATTAAAGALQVTSSDPSLRFKATGTVVVDQNTYEIREIGTTGNTYLQFRTVNDASSVFTTRMALWYSGGLYLGNSGSFADPGATNLWIEGAFRGMGITSPSSTAFTIGTQSFGTSISFASATGIPTFQTSVVVNGTSITTPATSWIGPSSAAGLNYVSGSVGLGLGSAVINSTGIGADTFVVTVGGTGAVKMGLLELAGTRTTDALLGQISFLNATTRVSGITAARAGADNTSDLEFYTSNGGSYARRLMVAANGDLSATGAVFAYSGSASYINLNSGNLQIYKATAGQAYLRLTSGGSHDWDVSGRSTTWGVSVDGGSDLISMTSTGVTSLTVTSASTASTSGALLLVGGVGINNTTDAASSTNGGTFTSAGGGAFAKSVYVGGTFTVTGAFQSNAAFALNNATARLDMTSTTGTNAGFVTVANTGGTLYWGLDSSTASSFGTAGNYGTVIYRPAATAFAISRNGTVDLLISSAGLVTLANSLTMNGTLTFSNGTPRISTNDGALLIEASSGNLSGVLYVAPSGSATTGKLQLYGAVSSSSNYVRQEVTQTGSNTTYQQQSVGTGVLGYQSFEFNGSYALRLTGSTLAASFNGNVTTDTAGKTFAVKSGANAAAGTVTLIAGAATITSTAIDVNTVIIFSDKTAGGTPSVYQPVATVSAGSAAVTGLATDTSTYNWVALKVN